MSTVTHFILKYVEQLLRLLKSTSFAKAVLVGIAVTLPVVAGILTDHLEVGLALCYGAYWSSPSDIIGSFQQKKIGILTSALLVTVISFIGGNLHYETWLSLPVLGILGFGISFISVYGFRASLISFSGLLALVLSLSHESKEIEVYQYALLIGGGGLWYWVLVSCWHRLDPNAETEELLTESYELTADFLEIRGKLIDPYEDQDGLQSELQQLQIKLTEHHETLREILITSSTTAEWSNYQGKSLLILVQLVEMLETAIANPGNYNRTNALFRDHPGYIASFQRLIFEMSRQLRLLSGMRSDAVGVPNNRPLRDSLKKIRDDIQLLQEELHFEEYIMLQNLLGYQEKQFDRLKRIKWLSGKSNVIETDSIDRVSANRFITPKDYDPLLLVKHLRFDSTIFRHSLRLAVTIMIGYTLGSIFPLQNPYWILLTIIIVIRPSYGLTKNRAKDRITGTVIGGLIAIGIVFSVHNPYVYGMLSVISLIISLSMVRRNYTASATFITLGVVFIYAITQPDILTVIKFRILDTIIGAGLSYVAMRYFWPTWELRDINKRIEKSVNANQQFLRKITEYYQRKGNIPTSYSIARKEAFVEASNLSSALQRTTQKPKSKQANSEHLYKLVALNHSLLASLSSLSTYIQSHETGEASEQFGRVVTEIGNNLDRALHRLNDPQQDAATEPYCQPNTLFEGQRLSFDSLGAGSPLVKDKEALRNLRERHLVWDQLRCLYSTSCELYEVAARLHRN